MFKRKKSLIMDMTEYFYHAVIARDMAIKMEYGSSFDLVKLDKVTMQYTSKHVVSEPRNILLACVALQLVTGRTPYVTHAKRSVASFHLRKRMVLGCAVTLRKSIMFPLVTQCMHIVLPKSKETTSLPISPLQPNVHFGIEQMLFFPLLEKYPDHFESLEGCSISIHTTAKKHVEALLLLSGLRIPTHSNEEKPF